MIEVSHLSPSLFTPMMNEQYAYAIAFDQAVSEHNSHADQSSPDWSQLLTQISHSITSEGFPELDHPPWEEFGDGRIFWGTKQECDTLKNAAIDTPTLVIRRT